jgi:iron complex outermembrane receptor protein
MFGSEASIQVNSKQLTGYAAVFYNYFLNYIFLAPTTEQYIGLPIYRYMQQDAIMQGIDASLSYNPKSVKWLTWNQNYAMVQGTRNDGVNLPFMPPPKFTSELRGDFRLKEQSLFMKTSATYVMEQNQLAMFEKYTPSYSLINAGIGAILSKKNCEYNVSVTCNNLLNTVYYDHLSRYKYFVANGNPVYNMGRNLVINVSIKFTKSLKHENANDH